MRHYEIVILIHPNQSSQVLQMIERYQSMIRESGSRIHRLEDWGRRQLAYPIKKVHKAHYILINIECSGIVLSDLVTAFHYNDAIMRSLILKRSHAITIPSPVMQGLEKEKIRKEKLGNHAIVTTESLEEN
ncbi:30S ribosomal protein S6 [Coxiella endosymbiont of Amblyomma americanum]|uniref:30S ribosomal protein S6 n=1 Tax=Coxiella endosymbiont of Amblyomma americanum TaxID=325775 RepID=UPI00057CD410|nr:30S ribosomal protein S6 [Coxiella endosymbiont of Amblyomma americanum]AJC50556.1 30S ribosomal protein S6 [Coxiella endosymbiont of Amblyomma americanum]AUJ58890.1 30S ribosomal protein S6 [Coxiella-like endosymbiont of Amblyomma americanum]